MPSRALHVYKFHFNFCLYFSIFFLTFKSKFSGIGLLCIILWQALHTHARFGTLLIFSIGNLLSNAIEGCLTLENPQERFIRIYIGKFKEQLYISVSNSYLGVRKKSGGKYATTKTETSSHGFGLLRVDSIAKKYNGYVNRQSEEGIFATEIMLPL